MNVPVCKDCAHVVTVDSAFPRCLHPKLARKDMVTGEVWGPDCALVRDASGGCGPLGKLFEPKPPLRWKFWRREKRR